MALGKKRLAMAVAVLWTVCMAGCGMETNPPGTEESNASESRQTTEAAGEESKSPDKENAQGREGSVQGAWESDVCASQASMAFKDADYIRDSPFSAGTYRVVRVNAPCPVDVTIYDAEGRMIASIMDDEPEPDGGVVVSVTNAGEKRAYLPIYYNYMVKLTATDDGAMNYAVLEYDPSGGTNRLVLFNDIAITDGQEYMAYIPRYSDEVIEGWSKTATDATDTEYALFLGTTQILPDEELTKEDVDNTGYIVSVVENDIEKGWAFCSGALCQYGGNAKVTATAWVEAGYKFVGWYEGDKLVSTEEEYIFRVVGDTELTAVFE